MSWEKGQPLLVGSAGGSLTRASQEAGQAASGPRHMRNWSDWQVRCLQIPALGVIELSSVH
jgi:uracil-DNA glycosylase